MDFHISCNKHVARIEYYKMHELGEYNVWMRQPHQSQINERTAK